MYYPEPIAVQKSAKPPSDECIGDHSSIESPGVSIELVPAAGLLPGSRPLLLVPVDAPSSFLPTRGRPPLKSIQTPAVYLRHFFWHPCETQTG